MSISGKIKQLLKEEDKDSPFLSMTKEEAKNYRKQVKELKKK